MMYLRSLPTMVAGGTFAAVSELAASLKGRTRWLVKLTLGSLACIILITGQGTGVLADTETKERADAKASASREYRIKAAFLYNFAKFTVWPAEAFADAKAPLRLCVLGEDPFHGALAALEGRTVKNRPIVASRLESTDSPEKCHLLFVSASEAKRVGTILKSLRGMPVLAVGDTPSFARSGGIIRLETVENPLRNKCRGGPSCQAEARFAAAETGQDRRQEDGILAATTGTGRGDGKTRHHHPGQRDIGGTLSDAVTAFSGTWFRQ